MQHYIERIWFFTKTLIFVRFHWKIKFLGRGVAKKKKIYIYIYSGELPGGIGQFADLRGAWEKMAIFEGVDTPMYTMVCLLLLSYIWFWLHIYWHLCSFFPYDIWKFSKVSGSYNFILFKNLLLYIWPLIYLFVFGRKRL